MLAVTVSHFCCPLLIFANTGVSKISVMVLKSIKYALFLEEFGQLARIHNSNKKKY